MNQILVISKEHVLVRESDPGLWEHNRKKYKNEQDSDVFWMSF